MVRLTYSHRGEWVLALEPDGRVLVRQDGGPTYHFGHVHNLEVPTVSAWRARVPAARHAALVASFEEAQVMKDDSMPLAGEQGSLLRLGETARYVGHRALESNLALDRIVTELAGVAAALRASPPAECLPNPERDRWSELPSHERRPGPGAPEPQAGAAEQAQAAVDRFYAEHLDVSLARVASRPRPRPAGSVEPGPPPVEDATHTFPCRTTGTPAGTVALRLTPLLGGGELSLSGFSEADVVPVRVKENELRALHRQLVAGDARSLYNHDDALVPFYCPQCDGCFAASQWKIYETSPTRIEGTCPSGHRRRMRAG